MEVESKQKKKKKKKKKNKKNKKTKRNRESSSEGENSDVDPFDDVLHEAVRDSHLDNIAARQLKELADIQAELLKLQQSSNKEDTSSQSEGEEDDQYNPPSNQQARYENNGDEVLNLNFHGRLY